MIHRTANFPYLVAPHTAIENEVRSHGKSVESILDRAAYSQIEVLAQRADEVNGACIGRLSLHGSTHKTLLTQSFSVRKCRFW
jgi:hypothetical protein